jgi:50S ribosomal protein L16 3-hydroxylase
LPRSHWTLLVEGVDRHVPALADLLDSFAFLPRWRVDDVMVSVASDQGTVGPHIDRYDVFLLQGQGRRRWQIDPQARDIERPGLDLRVLRSFKAAAEWVLGPGDMLYLPPGLAHFGVAQGDCLTYSIGFRAPRVSDLLLGSLERLARRLDPAWLYEDGDLEPQDEPGEIGPRALGKMRALMDAAWARTSPGELLGEILTEPVGLVTPPRTQRLRPQDLRARLRSGAILVRDPASRASFLRRRTGALLFVDGRTYCLPKSLAAAAPLLTRDRRVDANDLLPLLAQPGFLALLTDIVNAGSYDLERPGPSPPPARARRRAGSPAAKGSRSRGAARLRGARARGGRHGA